MVNKLRITECQDVEAYNNLRNLALVIEDFKKDNEKLEQKILILEKGQQDIDRAMAILKEEIDYVIRIIKGVEE